MKEFRSLEDVDAAGLPDGLSGVVSGTLKSLIDAYAEIGDRYDPSADGHTVLVEAGDITILLRLDNGDTFLVLDPSLDVDALREEFADVRCENRRAHQKPPQVPPGQEIVACRVFRLPDRPRGDPQ